ncbi:MAG: amidase [Deltaproteobacteria bacterium]|nr:amidase [Deltaproteobacteria bacterium]
MGWNDVFAATALEQAALIRARSISSEELTRAYLERIERMNPRLNAFVSLFQRRALAAARSKDAALRRGEDLPTFHGVPTAIKDLNVVRWSRTRMGSRGMIPLILPIDDRTTAAVRRGGFVILGKTATSELGAMPVTEPDTHAPTRNPWNLGHSPGGSSGGAAAAVAARLLPIAQGSDGGGSIRGPSSFCHLFGIKPSRGRVPNAFAQPDKEVIYTSGPIARGVEDAAAMLDVLAGLDVGRPHWATPPVQPYRASSMKTPPRLKVRFVTRSPLGQTDPEIAEAVERAARVLEGLGHAVEPGTLPECTLEEFLPVWQHLIASVPLIRWSLAQPITRWLVEGGQALPRGLAKERRRALEARFLSAFGDADLWLTPTTPVAAPAIGAFANRPPAEAFADAARIGAFTAAFNVTGQPATNVPLGLNRAGLPMGLQIAGRPFADDVVLSVSRQLELAMPWAARVAPLG